jgi:ABC-type nitrate/sulfonate/bicarbonate transport system substrate-binding protein
MSRKVFFAGLAVLTILAFVVNRPLPAAEKLKFGSGVKRFHPYYLPIFAAEEKGFWAKNGLDTEWVPFNRPSSFHHALASGSLKMGVISAPSIIMSISRGVPAVIVAEVLPLMEFIIWVRTDSGIKKGEDLRGKKVGVSRLRSVADASAKVMTRGLGVEKDVKIVATGGIMQAVAALQSGAVDATVVAMFSAIAKLKVAGKITELAGMSSYVPKEWVDIVVISNREFAATKPDTVTRGVRGFVQGMEFVRNNPTWSTNKIKEFEKLPEKTAASLFGYYKFSQDGKIKRKSVENVRNFLLEYEIISAAKAPPVDALYTNRFTP